MSMKGHGAPNQGTTLKEMLRKLAMKTEVRLVKLTEKEVQFYTRRKSPKKKNVVTISSSPQSTPQTPNNGESSLNPEIGKLLSGTYTNNQPSIINLTSPDMKRKSTGIKRSSLKDRPAPKKFKRKLNSQSMSETDQLVTSALLSQLTSPQVEADSTSSAVISGMSAVGKGNALNNGKIKKCDNKNSGQEPRKSSKSLKKVLLDVTQSALKTPEIMEKPFESFERSSLANGSVAPNVTSTVQAIEENLIRLDTDYFKPNVMAEIIELSKIYSNAFLVMSGFDNKISEMQLNPNLSAAERERGVSVLKQKCQSNLTRNHALRFSEIFTHIVNSFGISFRWELVVILYCRVLKIFYKMNSITDLKHFFEARNLMTFLLAGSNYKNEFVFKVLNLQYPMFSSLIISTYRALRLDIEIGDLNQQLDGGLKASDYKSKDGGLHSNGLTLCNQITNNNNLGEMMSINYGINDVNSQCIKPEPSVPRELMTGGFKQPVSQLIEDHFLKSMPTYVKQNNSHVAHPSIYPLLEPPKSSPQNINKIDINDSQCIIPQPKQGQPQLINQGLQQQGYPQEAYRGLNSQQQNFIPQQQDCMQAPNKLCQYQNQNINQQQQSSYPLVPNSNVQPQNQTINQQQQSSYPLVPNSKVQPQNQTINQQQQSSYPLVPNSKVQPQNQTINQQQQSSYPLVPNSKVQPQNQTINQQQQSSYPLVPNSKVQPQNQTINQQQQSSYPLVPNRGLQSQNRSINQHSGYLPVPNREVQPQNQGINKQHQQLFGYPLMHSNKPQPQNHEINQQLQSGYPAVPNIGLQPQTQGNIHQPWQSSNPQVPNKPHPQNHSTMQQRTNGQVPNKIINMQNQSCQSSMQKHGQDTSLPHPQNQATMQERINGQVPNKMINIQNQSYQGSMQKHGQVSSLLSKDQGQISPTPGSIQQSCSQVVSNKGVMLQNQRNIQQRELLNYNLQNQALSSQYQRNIQQLQQIGNPCVPNNFPQPPPYPGVIQNPGTGQQQKNYSQLSVTESETTLEKLVRDELSRIPSPVQNTSNVVVHLTSPIKNSNYLGTSPSDQTNVNGIHPTAPQRHIGYTNTYQEPNPTPFSNPNSHVPQHAPKTPPQSILGRCFSSQNQVQKDRPAGIPAQPINQIDTMTPKENLTVNYKIRLPLSSPRNGNLKAVVDRVIDSSIKADNGVIRMAQKPAIIGNGVELIPSPLKTNSIIKPSQPVPISSTQAHQIAAGIGTAQPNKTLAANIENGGGASTTMLPVNPHQLINSKLISISKLPDMPVLPQPTPTIDNNLADLQDFARFSNESKVVAANMNVHVEKGIKLEPLDSTFTCATTPNTAGATLETITRTTEQTITAAPVDNTDATTEAQIKAEVPDYLSVFGKCRRTDCTKAATCVCSGCRKAVYCGTQCQEVDWAEQHSSTCGNE